MWKQIQIYWISFNHIILIKNKIFYFFLVWEVISIYCKKIGK